MGYTHMYMLFILILDSFSTISVIIYHINLYNHSVNWECSIVIDSIIYMYMYTVLPLTIILHLCIVCIP